MTAVAAAVRWGAGAEARTRGDWKAGRLVVSVARASASVVEGSEAEVEAGAWMTGSHPTPSAATARSPEGVSVVRGRALAAWRKPRKEIHHRVGAAHPRVKANCKPKGADFQPRDHRPILSQEPRCGTMLRASIGADRRRDWGAARQLRRARRLGVRHSLLGPIARGHQTAA